MTRVEQYVIELDAVGSGADDVHTFLTEHSNLPGPRGNLELAHAYADWASDDVVDALAVHVDDEYLQFCTALALGQRLARGEDPELVRVLRSHAADSRWRVREGVATGLQRVGDADLPRLCDLVLAWVDDDDPLVRRAAIAAICEPRLLKSASGAVTALEACDRATSWLAALPADRRRDGSVRTLRQALGYCWSVAIAADPAAGLARFEQLRESVDPDVHWIVRENLKKARLRTLLPGTD